ncbi:fimbrial protein [Parabacteroides sp. APC149_11_2_Y6]
MKSLVWMFAAILAMSACSSKDDIPNNRTDEDAPLSVVFSVENETTKAVGGEIGPSEKEVNVKRYHVALFKNGTRVDHKEYGDGTGSSLLPAGANTYKASFRDVVEGNVAVYVIANYPSGQTFPDTDWGTYEQYKAQSVTSDLNETDGLVKVGYKEFTVNSIETGKTVLNLSLIQLTARLDITLNWTDRELEEHTDKAESKFLEETKTDVVKYTDEKDIDKYVPKETIMKTLGKYLEYETSSAKFAWASALDASAWNGWVGNEDENPRPSKFLAKEDGSLYLRAKIKEAGSNTFNSYMTDFKIDAYTQLVDAEVTVPVFGFTAGKIDMENLNKKSNICIYNDKAAENQAYEADLLEPVDSSFYTYEIKGKEMKLNVEIGKGLCLYRVYKKQYRRYGYKIYRGQWVEDLRGNRIGYNWDRKGGYPLEAWNEVAPQLIKEYDGYTDTPAVAPSLTDSHSYTLNIPVATVEKITKGHIYQVRGTHTTIVKPVITWEVVGMDKVDVNPEPFK